jgi:PhoH-like ATPase
MVPSARNIFGVKQETMSEKKIYILDTNILIHDPEALYGFAPAIVGIPTTVLEELDHFKTENTQRGRNAREAIRHLDVIRQQGSLAEGVKLENKGVVQVLFAPQEYTSSATKKQLPRIPESPDNSILLTALLAQSQGYEVTFISKDINMRVKADVYGLTTQDYLKDVVSHDEFYRGWMTVQVPAVVLKRDIQKYLQELRKDYKFSVNEYVLVESKHNEHMYRLYRFMGNEFKEVQEPALGWPIKARNPQQLIALDLLLDDTIKLVTLLGPAGTGKTFLALVAGLHKVLIEQMYTRMLISRPVVPLGPDIGYLPGDVHEKLHSWMQPIYDNMDFIAHTAHMAPSVSGAYQQHEHEEHRNREHDDYRRKSGKKHRDKSNRSEQQTRQLTLDDLIRQAKVSLEAITYMRGRSIPYQFIFIDEVQNLTPHEVKTIISRVGEGSKIILAGDPYQIDSPYLDFTSNGLMVAAQKFKGYDIAGTAYLQTSERSQLSQLAGELL